MRNNGVLHTTRDLLVPVYVGAPITPVPHSSFLEAAAIVQNEGATLIISQEHNAALADILLVPMRLANSVAIERYTKKFVGDKPLRQHGVNVVKNVAMRMVLTLLLLVHPALRILLLSLGNVKSAGMGLGYACPVGLLAPFVATKHALQHGVLVNHLGCTGSASIGTWRTSKTLNN